MLYLLYHRTLYHLSFVPSRGAIADYPGSILVGTSKEQPIYGM
jgi:hypothetical protein